MKQQNIKLSCNALSMIYRHRGKLVFLLFLGSWIAFFTIPRPVPEDSLTYFVDHYVTLDRDNLLEGDIITDQMVEHFPGTIESLFDRALSESKVAFHEIGENCTCLWVFLDIDVGPRGSIGVVDETLRLIFSLEGTAINLESASVRHIYL